VLLLPQRNLLSKEKAPVSSLEVNPVQLIKKIPGLLEENSSRLPLLMSHRVGLVLSVAEVIWDHQKNLPLLTKAIGEALLVVLPNPSLEHPVCISLF